MKKIYFPILFILIIVVACNDDDLVPMDNCNPTNGGDLSNIEYDPQDYNLIVPNSFPDMFIPEDNPLTVDGVNLGRHLFYDPILSADSTMACANCHLAPGSFTDNLAVSTGIDGVAGNRSSMSLLNVGFFYTGLFWDGRSMTLEEQALLPVEDPIELHHEWSDLVPQLRNHGSYPELFRKAFGITNTSEINKELAAKALAQFERTLVSSGNSRFEKIEAITPGFFYTEACLLYTSPSPRDATLSRMPSSA